MPVKYLFSQKSRSAFSYEELDEPYGILLIYIRLKNDAKNLAECFFFFFFFSLCEEKVQ